ncbi:uncharacterized protein LOC115468918 isoform X2 [Microcaecilia unicolor]|uniref:Uncharacterized protein LOC115468918 isoform X2 n=1 Tax=Microcaecilia unicolor TaxID=1415580 RepID=A0A6P7Y259_9AMPH|nr:uncharacterized protein LOC115468918 isoform X2 [Microcaecilia unicolor]
MARGISLASQLLFAAFFIIHTADADIKLKMSGSPLQIAFSENVALECLLLDYSGSLDSETLGVLWKFGEADIISYAAGRFNKHWDNVDMSKEDLLRKNMTLHLRNVSVWHEGTYTCKVFIVPAHKVSGSITLIISARPFVTVSSPESVEVGREASLLCKVNGYYGSDIQIQWIRVKNDRTEFISANVCQGRPVVNLDGRYNVSVEAVVEPVQEDIGSQYACLVKHRSFSPNYIEKANFTVKEQKDDTSAHIVIGIVIGCLITLILSVIFYVYYRGFYEVSPKVSQIKVLSRFIHKEKARLKIDVSGFTSSTIQISWYRNEDEKVIKRWRKIEKALHWKRECSRDGHQSGSRHNWKATLSDATKTTDGTYCLSSELEFEPDIEEGLSTEITCEIMHKKGVKPIVRRIAVTIEGVPPKLSEIIKPPIVLHNVPVTLICPINFFKPRGITVSWCKKSKEGQVMEIVKLHRHTVLSEEIAENAQRKYEHSVDEIGFPDATYSMNSKLLFKPTIEEDDDFEYCCKVMHMSLREPLEIKVQLDIKVRPVIGDIICNTVNPELGKPLELMCKIHSFYPQPITVKWLKATEVLPESKIWNTYDYEDKMKYEVCSQYSLAPTLEDEKKKFVCRVEHESLSQPMQQEYTLPSLAIAPEVGTIWCSSSEPEVGRDLTLSCAVEKYFPRQIQVEWYRGHTRIDKEHVCNVERFEHRAFYMTSSVTIKPTRDDHCTEFRIEVCHSTISTKPIAQTFILKFPGLPNFLPFCLDPLQPVYGQPLALKCSVEGFDSKEFEVSWVQDGEELTKGVQNSGPFNTPVGYKIESVLNIMVTARNFEKEIIFKVHNNCTKQTFQHRLMLPLSAVSPEISEITLSKDVPRLGEITLSCTARGFSPGNIKVLWSRGWTDCRSSDFTQNLVLEENALADISFEERN